MSLGGSFMPLGAQLCTLGLFYAPWGSSARPPLCVRSLGYFKPFEGSIMPLGDQVRIPSQTSAPPYACVPPLCVYALDSFKPLKAHICPLGVQLCSLGSSARFSRCTCPPLQECASPPRRAHPSHQAYAPPPQACAPSQPGMRAPSSRRTRPPH
jgi:hypothetical protein